MPASNGGSGITRTKPIPCRSAHPATASKTGINNSRITRNEGPATRAIREQTPQPAIDAVAQRRRAFEHQQHHEACDQQRCANQIQHQYNAVFSPPLDPALDRNSPNAARFPRPTTVTNAAGAPALQGSPNDATWNSMTAADQQTVLRITANFAKAIAAYQRLLISRGAPFDRFIAGDANAISDQVKRGAALYVGKARCISCHNGPLFSDNLFHNIGEGAATETGRAGANPATGTFSISSIYSDDRDFGAARLASILRDDSQNGAWRTPTLRGVAQTAPYLRTGRLATLEDVVDFYNVGTSRLPALNLTSDEKAALVAFLNPHRPADSRSAHNRYFRRAVTGSVKREWGVVSVLPLAIARGLDGKQEHRSSESFSRSTVRPRASWSSRHPAKDGTARRRSCRPSSHKRTARPS
jgi:hypothetical protein